MRLSALRLPLFVWRLLFVPCSIARAQKRAARTGVYFHLSPRAGEGVRANAEVGFQATPRSSAQRRGPLIPTFSPQAGRRSSARCEMFIPEEKCDHAPKNLSRPVDARAMALAFGRATLPAGGAGGCGSAGVVAQLQQKDVPARPCLPRRRALQGKALPSRFQKSEFPPAWLRLQLPVSPAPAYPVRDPRPYGVLAGAACAGANS